MSKHRFIREARERRALHVADGEHLSAVLFRKADRLQGIRRFSALTDGNEKRIISPRPTLREKFACDAVSDGHAGDLSHRRFEYQSGMIGTAAPEHRYLAVFSAKDTPDGLFGAITINAIASWQHQKGLTPDGKFGPQSKAAAGF